VLDALGEKGASATFFMLLTRVRAHPGFVGEVRAAGHEVALHGLDHRALTALDPKSVERRLRDNKSELEDVAGTEVRWLRPPYGSQSPATWRATRRAGLMPVMWSAGLGDSRPIDDAARLAGLRSRLRAGVIILAHDNFADASDGAADGDLPAVDRYALSQRMLAMLDDAGLAGCSLARALETGAARRRAWFGRR